MADALFDTYMTQLFTTLGQISAVVLSTTVVVPMYNFYTRRYMKRNVR